MRWTAAPWMLIAAACRPTPTPCVSSDACGTGQECLANHCALLGSDPVPPDATRYVLEPSAIAVLSANRPTAAAGVPPTVSFGGRVDGTVAWYLDFAAQWATGSDIDRAFLVLSPATPVSAATLDVELTVWRVAEPWAIRDLTWNEQPKRSPPRAVGIASATPPQVVRIDVTRIVRFWQRYPRYHHGLTVESRGGSGHGIGFATGAGGGVGPRLEVYLAEAPRDRLHAAGSSR